MRRQSFPRFSAWVKVGCVQLSIRYLSLINAEIDAELVNEVVIQSEVFFESSNKPQRAYRQMPLAGGCLA